jgi:uncharacterized protein YgiM (DUF1202 family)
LGGTSMKRIFLAMIMIGVFASAGFAETYNQQLKQNRDMVRQQFASDKEKKEAILRMMREFRSEINGRLGKESKTKIDPPVDMNAVTDIKKTDMVHSPKKVPAPVYAFVNEDLYLNAEADEKSKQVVKVAFGEKVEVVLQTVEVQTINGLSSPWAMVRRATGEEGWIFGGYLVKEVPVRKLKTAIVPAVTPEEKKEPEMKPAGAFFAYIADSDVRFRDSYGTGSNVIGRFEFGEKVEVLEQSKMMETINGKERPWFRVRRASMEEGWVFGGFLQKRRPEPKTPDAMVPVDEQRITESSRSGFMVPTVGRTSSQFGYRVHPVTKRSQSFHSGIDIQAPKGTKINATADGVVKKAEFNRNGYGNLIIIEHEQNIASYYGHLESILVTPGQQVKKGDIIGTVDSTGLSTGHHLHFEIRKGGTALDPDAWLK